MSSPTSEQFFYLRHEMPSGQYSGLYQRLLTLLGETSDLLEQRRENLGRRLARIEAALNDERLACDHRREDLERCRQRIMRKLETVEKQKEENTIQWIELDAQIG